MVTAVRLVPLNLIHAICKIVTEVHASFNQVIQDIHVYVHLDGVDQHVQNVQVGIMVPTANINVQVELQIFAMGTVLVWMENQIAVHVPALVVILEIHVMFNQINVMIFLHAHALQLLDVGIVYQVIGVVIVALTEQLAATHVHELDIRMQLIVIKGGMLDGGDFKQV